MEDLFKNIPKNLRDKCVVKNGVVYCPEIDLLTGKIIRTAQEIIDGVNKQEKEPTETEILQKQLLETQAIVANLQEQILLNQNGGK